MTNTAESYRHIVCRVVALTARSVLVQTEKSESSHWIPRSLIHGGDEIGLNNHQRGEIVTLRIMAWKVQELGL